MLTNTLTQNEQREQVHTVKDALQYISTPSSVQVTSPSRPGITLDASQQVLIETLPPILVLHMKRFLYDTKVNGVVKIGKQVSFGPELEIQLDIIAPARKHRSLRSINSLVVSVSASLDFG
jgi:ubiquitin carboxyl-terminal hydrolase 10